MAALQHEDGRDANQHHRVPAGHHGYTHPSIYLPVSVQRELESAKMHGYTHPSIYLPGSVQRELEFITKMGVIRAASNFDVRGAADGVGIYVPLDRIEDPHLLKILNLVGTPVNRAQHAAVQCLGIGKAFDAEPLTESEAMAVLIQAAVNVCGSSVIANESFCRILATSDITIDEVQLRSGDPATTERLVRDELYQANKELLNYERMSNPQAIMLAYSGTILLLIGKYVTKDAVKTWTERRVRGLAAAMKSTIDPGIIVPVNLKTAQRIYVKFRMHVSFRAALVRILIGSAGIDTLRGSICSAILNFLAWSEMSHIRCIQENIIDGFPELLSVRAIQAGGLRNMGDAWDFLMGLEERERPFAKLLFDNMKTKVLHREHFPLIADAAYAVAEYRNPTFKNYKGKSPQTSSASQAIKNIVANYLSQVEKITGKTLRRVPVHVTTLDQRDMSNAEKAEGFFGEYAAHFVAEEEESLRN